MPVHVCTMNLKAVYYDHAVPMYRVSLFLLIVDTTCIHTAQMGEPPRIFI
jgi:hypothetical protein